MGLALSFNLAKLTREHKFDVLSCHDSHAHSAAILATRLYGLKSPIVVHRKLDYAVGKNAFSRAKYCHSSIRAFICVSDKVKDVLAQTVKSKNLLHVVYDGIDIHRFQNKAKTLKSELNIGSDEVLIGNVAALSNQKDPFSFIQAAQILLKAGVKARFVWIGEGELYEEVQQQIRRLKLEEKVKFLGFRKDVESLLPDLDLLLFTSQNEGLGTSVLDAFTAGVPVVCTNAGGLQNFIRHQQNAFMAEVGKPKSLAGGVQWMLSDQSRREEIIHEALSDVQNFSYEKMGISSLEVYQEVSK